MKKKTYLSVLITIIFIFSLTSIIIAETDTQKLLNNAPVKEDYPQASAIYLKSHSIIDHTNDKSKIHKRRVIKVFNDRGVEEYGEFKIRFNRSNENIKIKEVKTIKKNGEILQPEDKAINEITPPEASEASIYSDARIKVISMPGVEPGSILICDYVITKESYAMEGEFWNYLLFQTTDPIKESKLVLKTPLDKDINYKVKNGDLPPKINEKEDSKTYTWKRTDIPAIIKEKNMPSLMNIAPFIQISTVQSWSNVSEWYQTLIDEQYKVNEEIKDKITELTKNSESETEAIKALYNYVTSQIRYIGLQFGESGYKPYSAVTTFEKKYGVCKEKATLLIAMLREIGVKAEPVLINRGSTTIDMDIKSPAIFNHMIIYLPEKDKYLDPTSQGTMYGVLPGDQGKNVLLPEKDKITKTPVSEATKNISMNKQVVNLRQDGSAVINYNEKKIGLYGFTYKRIFQNYNSEQRKKLIKRGLSRGFSNPKIEKVKISGVNNLNKNLQIELPKIESKNYAEQMGNMLTFNPLRFPINLAQVVSADSRNYPLNLSFKRNVNRKVEINIPDKYEINYIPEDKDFENDIGSFRVNYTKTESKILLDFNLIIDQVEISPEDYNKAKKLINKASEEIQNQIMIKKQ